MGISNVAVKTFDSSGSQSLCRTNEYSGDEEVKSSFISKCQKMYISGSGETVIPGSLRTFPTTKSVDTFNINADTDAISDMIFNIEFRFKNPDTTTITNPLFASVSKDIILAIIDRVEIKMGSLTVQTLTPDDIYIRNLTELGVPYNFHGPVSADLLTDPLAAAIGSSETHLMNLYAAELQESFPRWENRYSSGNYTDVYLIQASCSLPFIGRNKDMSRALLQAGALTNAVTVKVYYNELYRNVTAHGGSSIQVISGGNPTTQGFPTGSDYLDLGYFKSHLKVRTHIMTAAEKKFISKNIIHKVLNTSSNVVKTIPRNLNVAGITDTTTQIEVDLENVSHNVSHLLIAVRLPHVHNKIISCNNNFLMPLRSDRVSNKRDAGATPFRILNRKTLQRADTPYMTHYNTDNYEVYGYMPCPIESMELVIGSDRTGFIKGSSAQLDTCENFDLKYTSDNKAFYMITLAEKAFDTAGVAFSKINNKKLIINLNDNIFSQIYEDNSLNKPKTTYTQDAIITVTACGTKVQTVVGGSMSFM